MNPRIEKQESASQITCIMYRIRFDQFSLVYGEYGVAETLSKAKDTSVGGMVDAGILVSGKGKVRLLRPAELTADWDPATDTRLTN